MKEFNLTEYLKDPSQKVVTRDRREVRIICTDFKDQNKPIIALIKENEKEENVFNFRENGRWHLTKEKNQKDLFFAPIKKVGWVNIYQDPDEDEYPRTGNIYESKEEAITKREKIDYKATIKIEWEE